MFRNLTDRHTHGRETTERDPFRSRFASIYDDEQYGRSNGLHRNDAPNLSPVRVFRPDATDIATFDRLGAGRHHRHHLSGRVGFTRSVELRPVPRFARGHGRLIFRFARERRVWIRRSQEWG